MIQVDHPGSQIQGSKRRAGSGSATLLFVLDLYPDPWILESKGKLFSSAVLEVFWQRYLYKKILVIYSICYLKGMVGSSVA